jgi:hypothetical protein
MGLFMFKVTRNKKTIYIAQDFCSSLRRRNRRIAGYATISATQKTGKKTSKMGELFIARCA